MKSLTELRRQLVGEQQKILNAIWEHYRTAERWPFASVLYGCFGKDVVDVALKDLGSSIVAIHENPYSRKCFRLTILGLLLTDQGEYVESRLIEYLNYVQEQLRRDPNLQEIAGSGFSSYADLSETQSNAFYTFLSISPFMNGGHGGKEGWGAGLPPWIDDLLAVNNMHEFFEKRVLAGLDTTRQEPSGPALQIETATPSPRVSQQVQVDEMTFVSPQRIDQLRRPIGSTKFDFTKLIRLCEELNECYARGCYLATAMLTRALVDHVPPLFGCGSFAEIANNYGGTKSLKEQMQHLDRSSRMIADAHLHTMIRSQETLPTATQVNFANDIDVLLAEIVRISK